MSPKKSRPRSVSGQTRQQSTHAQAAGSDGDLRHDQAAEPSTADQAPTVRKRVSPDQYNLQIFDIAMKPREGHVGGLGRVPPLITASSRTIAALLSLHLQDADREHLVVIPFNRQKAAIGITTVTMGDLSQATVEAREVFKPAILLNAIGIMVAKNRLSGVTEPTPYDFQQVKEWREVGWTLGCLLMDYIIVGYGGRYFSFHEEGQLPRVPLTEHLFGK